MLASFVTGDLLQATDRASHKFLIQYIEISATEQMRLQMQAKYDLSDKMNSLVALPENDTTFDDRIFQLTKDPESHK